MPPLISFMDMFLLVDSLPVAITINDFCRKSLIGINDFLCFLVITISFFIFASF